MKGRNFLIFFLFITLERETLAFLNNVERNIAAALMGSLRINHRILLEEPNLKLKDLRIFKSSIFWNKAAAYQNTNQIIKYFRKQSFPDPPTLIIYKAGDLKPVISLLGTMTKKKKIHYISKFTWLVFVDSFSKNYENRLPIPADSQFIIAYPTTSTSFKLMEMYKIKSQTVTSDFGNWNGKELKITEIPWYRRRMNLKNVTMTMAGFAFYGKTSDCLLPDMCGFYHYSQALSSTLNISFEYVKYQNEMEPFTVRRNWDLFEVPIYDILVYDFLDVVDISGQILIKNIDWYIREPKIDKPAEYYLQPFETQVWIITLVTLIIGSLTAVFVNYLLETEIPNKRQRFDVKDHFFMPFDSVCNQEAVAPQATVSSRIVSLSFRFQTLFLFGLYSSIVTSYSAVQLPIIPFRNVEEFLKNEQYKIAIPKQTESLFLRVNHPVIHAGSEKRTYFNSTAEFNDRICNEHITFANILAAQVRFQDLKCPLYQIDQPMHRAWLFTQFMKNSPFRVIFNHFIISFHSSGIRQRTYVKYMAYPAIKRRIPDFDVIGLKQTVQIFAIYITGVLISIVVIFFGELIFFSMNIKIKKWKKKLKEEKILLRKRRKIDFTG